MVHLCFSFFDLPTIRIASGCLASFILRISNGSKNMNPLSSSPAPSERSRMLHRSVDCGSSVRRASRRLSHSSEQIRSGLTVCDRVTKYFSGPKPFRIRLSLSEWAETQRHKDTEAQRRAIKRRFTARLCASESLCYLVVNV